MEMQIVEHLHLQQYEYLSALDNYPWFHRNSLCNVFDIPLKVFNIGMPWSEVMDVCEDGGEGGG